MESAVADEIVRRECGILSDRQRAKLGFRTLKGVVHAQEALLQTEVPGVAEAVAKSLKGKDPLQGMLALQRSAIQLRTATIFDPVKLVAPADYAFSTQFPVQKLLMILENQMITALPGVNANQIVDEGSAQKQAKQTELDTKYHNQIVSAGITKLAESYKHRIGALHGYHSSAKKTRDMKAAGLVAPSTFRQPKQGTLTREEQYAMFKRAWGDHRMGAITSLNLIVEGGDVDLSDETPEIKELASEFEEQTHTMPDGTEMAGEAHY